MRTAKPSVIKAALLANVILLWSVIASNQVEGSTSSGPVPSDYPTDEATHALGLTQIEGMTQGIVLSDSTTEGTTDIVSTETDGVPITFGNQTITSEPSTPAEAPTSAEMEGLSLELAAVSAPSIEGTTDTVSIETDGVPFTFGNQAITSEPSTSAEAPTSAEMKGLSLPTSAVSDSSTEGTPVANSAEPLSSLPTLPQRGQTTVSIEGSDIGARFSMTNHNTIRFHCRVSSDPSTPWTATWYLQRNGTRERLSQAQDGLSQSITTREHNNIMTTASTPPVPGLDLTGDRPPEATFGNREHSSYEAEVFAVQTSDAVSIVSTFLETRTSAGTKEQERDRETSTQPTDIFSPLADYATFYNSDTPTSNSSNYILNTTWNLTDEPPPQQRRKRSANIKSSVLSMANGTLIIDIGANNRDAWKSVEGDYVCVGKSAHGQDEKKLLIRLRDEEIFACTVSRAACFTVELNTIWNQIKNLGNATGLNSSKEAANTARLLSKVTNESSDLSSDDLITSIKAVDQLATFRKKNDHTPPTGDEIKSVIQTISNILRPTYAPSWNEQTNGTVVTMLMSSAETYGSFLCREENQTRRREEAQNLVLESFCLNTDLSRQRDDISFWKNEWNESRSDLVSISLPEFATDQLNENSSVWSLYYRNINKYLPNASDYLLDSRVLSLSTSVKNLKPRFEITFQHSKKLKTGWWRRNQARRCVFWKTDIEGGGDGWSDEGCRVVRSYKDRTVCTCDHLTNFAVLMSLNPSDDSTLSILSTVICTASVAALVLTITIHVVTWKHSKSHQHVLLLNLCVALFAAYLVFLVGSEKKFDDTGTSSKGENKTTADVQVGCKVVAVLLHYFFLAAFFVMLAEGIQLFIYVFFVFHARRKLETAALAVTAWVLPLIIVAICLWVTKTEGYGEGLACWLSYDKEGPQLIWAFIAPAFTILAINGVIIVVVFVKISCSRISSSKIDRKTKIRKMMWNIAVLCPVLGITWLFGILTVSSDNVTFQYIFAIVNSAQGIFIFIFHSLFVNEKFNAGLSTFCRQCVGDNIGSRKADKRRRSTKIKKTTKANPSDIVNLDIVNPYSRREMANEGFSYSSEKLPSFSDSSERSPPMSASDDTFLETSPVTSKTIDTLF